MEGGGGSAGSDKSRGEAKSQELGPSSSRIVLSFVCLPLFIYVTGKLVLRAENSTNRMSDALHVSYKLTSWTDVRNNVAKSQ